MKLNSFGRITKMALQRRKIIYFLIIILTFFSINTYQSMTKSILPEVKLPYVSIETYLVGASASEIEEMVTVPIENAIKGIKDIKKVTSSSGSGYSLVIIQFNEGIDAETKVQQIQTKINNIRNKLPKKIDAPIIEEYDISKFPIIAVELNANMPYQQLEKVVEDLESRLKAISNVKNITVKGLNKPSVRVIPIFQKINQLGIDYQTISELIKEYQFNIPLGSRKLSGMNYFFEANNRLTTIQTIKDIPLNLGANQLLKLSDIADVQYGNNEKIVGSFRIENGERKPIVSLLIYKKAKGDTVAIAQAVKTIVADYNDGLFNAEQYDIQTSMDASEYIQSNINDVFNNALGGLLSVIVVLFLFINLRESILASLVIPVTMIIAVLLFKTFNLTLNIMSIMGLIIALGMLVDNAIVVVEMIDEHKKQYESLSLIEIIIKATNSVATAIFSSTLTTVGAFIPLAFLSGAEGALIRTIPIATALAMTVSFIVSITVTPVFAYLFIKKVDKTPSFLQAVIYSVLTSILAAYAFSDQWKLTSISLISGVLFLIASLIKYYYTLRKNNRIKNGLYKRAINALMKSIYYQSIVLIVMIGLLIYSGNLLLSGHIPMEAMPKVDSKYLTGQITLVKGKTEQDSLQVFEQINSYLSARSDIEDYSVDIGKDTLALAIKLKPKKERKLHSEAIITELIAYVSTIPDVKGNFITEGNEANAAPISITLTNNDNEQLFADASKIKSLLENIPGNVSPRIDFEYGAPTITIDIDREMASKMEIMPSTLLAKIRELIVNQKVVKITLDGIKTDLYIEKANIFNSIEEMGQLHVNNSRGFTVLLKDVVQFYEQRKVNEIKHENYQKILKVKSNLAEGYTVNSILLDLKEQLSDAKILAPSTSYTFTGDFKAMEDSYSDLTEKFMIAALIVYVILLIQFNGFLQPIVIIISVPFSIIGVAIGYYLSGLTFSTLSFLGIVSLVGIAVNDAIVLIDYINTLRREQKYDKVESIIQGCLARFKPIIATSLTTMAGVAPLALYSEDYGQMAYALIFGLFGSTILTLFVVPVVLNIIENIIEKINNSIGEKHEKVKMV